MRASSFLEAMPRAGISDEACDFGGAQRGPVFVGVLGHGYTDRRLVAFDAHGA